MRNIAYADYMHAKRVCKDFKIKNWGEYHDFYLKSDTFLLPDVFEKFRKMCLEMCHLDLSNFIQSPNWHGMRLKKIRSKIRIIN